MSTPENPAEVYLSVRVSSDHYVRLIWQNLDGSTGSVKLNAGQAAVVGSMSGLAQQSYEQSLKEKS